MADYKNAPLADQPAVGPSATERALGVDLRTPYSGPAEAARAVGGAVSRTENWCD